MALCALTLVWKRRVELLILAYGAKESKVKMVHSCLQPTYTQASFLKLATLNSFHRFSPDDYVNTIYTILHVCYFLLETRGLDLTIHEII